MAPSPPRSARKEEGRSRPGRREGGGRSLWDGWDGTKTRRGRWDGAEGGGPGEEGVRRTKKREIPPPYPKKNARPTWSGVPAVVRRVRARSPPSRSGRGRKPHRRLPSESARAGRARRRGWAGVRREGVPGTPGTTGAGKGKTRTNEDDGKKYYPRTSKEASRPSRRPEPPGTRRTRCPNRPQGLSFRTRATRVPGDHVAGAGPSPGGDTGRGPYRRRA